VSPNPLQGLTRNQAETRPDHPDPELQGRTYAIPFDRVWTVALALAGGGLKGWSLRRADDQEGRIEAEAKGMLGALDDVEVRVTLDPNAQTRVDLTSTSRKDRGDLGRNRRRVRRFLRELDGGLQPAPGEILEPFAGEASS
jgi:hypothetical protein